MLTPWVNPVTAGKKIAKMPQNGRLDPGARLSRARLPSHPIAPPTKNPPIETNSTPMTTYWNRVAQSAPSHARKNSAPTAPAATIWGSRGLLEPTAVVTTSPNPIE